MTLKFDYTLFTLL
uniref:Uncharacterized protein n=1 Tax=Anguilla anguilla TaxID=7936 RepID=A0A0E9RWQ1_ANGAN